MWKVTLQPAVDENLSLGITHSASAGLPVNARRKSPISVLFLTTGLGVGGAEMMLYKLLSRMDRTRFLPQVISLRDTGPLSDKIQSLGVPLRSLGMRPGRPNPVSVLRLAQWLREDRPDVIQTWMYHADLIGGLAGKLAGGIPVAWGIHQSDLSSEGNRWHTLQTIKACAYLSRWLPSRILCCSEASWQAHATLGYATEQMVVVPNGFDLRAFKPDSAARESVRAELQIPVDAPLIGLVSRFHPQKDFHNFVQAAALLHRIRPDVHFLLCGEDVTWNNRQLSGWIDEAGIRARCLLVGMRGDIARLTAALDIATSSSFGEAFSNVIGEAMSCAVPCVVTDVGDSALIVGQTGRIVPPKNPMMLSSAWRELIELAPKVRTQLGLAARCRIQEHFDLSDIVMRYQKVYQDLADMTQEKWTTAGISQSLTR